MSDKGKGKINPQMMNIQAARMIADTVRSTLGPKGMDKMLVDGHGNVMVTNDGATILREVDIAHPGGKMIAEIAKTQESLCYDGTTSTVVLASALLGNTEQLFAKGLHPNVICKGYYEASQMATKFLQDEIAITDDSHSVLLNIARTAITGKTLEHAMDDVAKLCVSAVERAGSAENVKVVAFPGGSLTESSLYSGVIVNKDYVLESDNVYDNILLVNTGLDTEKTEENVQVQLDASNVQKYKTAGKASLIADAKHIVNALPNGGVVFVRDSVNDHVCAFLKKYDIMMVRRTPTSTLRSLSRCTGASIYQSPDEIEEATHAGVVREKHDDVWFLFVNNDNDSSEATLILRGATSHTLEENERGFDDALGVVSLVMKSGSYVVGGGNAFARMAIHLRTHAATVGGRAQMAIEAYADSLETIPATIAENAGHDPLDTVLAMRHSILSGDLLIGPDIENGGVTAMNVIGVYEPTELIKQAVLSATEVTTAILRIDDIIARRGVE
tara:strand:- start:3757 stop:5259 length:1503 start_codon:yes stop_codon:yes gene_type:complete